MGSTSSRMSVSPAIHYRDSQQDSYSSSNASSSSRHPAPAQVSLAANEITSLRAAALKSARGKREASESGSNTPARPIDTPPLLVAPDVSRSGSISTTLGLPFSRVEISDAEEKEEGEISEDEGPPALPSRLDTLYRRPPSSSLSPSQRNARHSIPPRPRLYSPPGPSSQSLPHAATPKPAAANKGKARESPGPVLPAPSDISESEARQYMDIIKNLLQEGFTPDTLVKRGATPKYVTAVCEEIVQGTKRRKALWLESRPLAPPSPPRSTGSKDRSPSAEVEVMVTTDRRASLSSEGSAEYELLENPSPPKPRPPRLIPSSHWAPPLKAAPTPPTHAIRIESYKPDLSVPGPSRSIPPPFIFPTTAINTLPDLPTLPSPIPGFPNPSVSAVPPSNITKPIHPPSSLPSKPPPTGPKSSVPVRRDKRRRFVDAIATDQVVLNYDEDMSPATAIPSTSLIPLSASTITPFTSIPPSASSTAQADLAAKNLLLETRRKALESMRFRRRPKASYEDMEVDTPASGSGFATPNNVVPTAVARNIEQEVLDLEREVMGLQELQDEAGEEAAEQDMDLDSPESGEIILSPVQASLPAQTMANATAAASSTPILSAASLSSTSRGIKRPNAEDLDSRPVSAPSWTQNRWKPFGSIGQISRPSLIINLDEQDSDSDDDDREPAQPLENPIDAKIRLLKEQIAAKMKAREAKRLKVESQSASSSTVPSPTPVNTELATDASLAADVDRMAQLEIERDDALNDHSQQTLAKSSGRQLQVEAEAPKQAEKRQMTGWTLAAQANDTSLPRVDEDSADGSPERGDDLMEGGPTETAPADTIPVEATGEAPSLLFDNTSPPDSAQYQASFSNYQPLLRRYPQLSATTHTIQSFPQFTISLSQEVSNPWSTINRPLLNSIILTNRTTHDRHAVLCKAEAGGGTCADQGCEDIHLDKGDPTVEDMTEYISQSLLSSGASAPSGDEIGAAVRRIISGLQAPQVISNANANSRHSKQKAVPSNTKDQIGLRNTLSSDEALLALLSKIAQAVNGSK